MNFGKTAVKNRPSDYYLLRPVDCPVCRKTFTIRGLLICHLERHGIITVTRAMVSLLEKGQVDSDLKEIKPPNTPLTELNKRIVRFRLRPI